MKNTKNVTKSKHCECGHRDIYHNDKGMCVRIDDFRECRCCRFTPRTENNSEWVEVLMFFLGTVAIFATIGFVMYFLFAFMNWLVNDPLNLIK
jgi:hypothetical protein